MLSILVKSSNRAESQVGKNASKKERFSKNILSGGCAGSLSLVFVQSIDYTRCTKYIIYSSPGDQNINIPYLKYNLLLLLRQFEYKKIRYFGIARQRPNAIKFAEHDSV